MKKKRPKDDPHLFFFGNWADLGYQLDIMKFTFRKIEKIDFKKIALRESPSGLDSRDIDDLILEGFPETERRSFIVKLIITLEDEFRGFCNLLREVEDIPIKWSQIKGSTLERFVIYIEKISGLKFLANKKLQNQIRGLIELRNCIVHANSYLPNCRNPKMVEDFVKSLKDCSLEDGILEISLDGCFESVKIIEEFMEKAYCAALDRYPEQVHNDAEDDTEVDEF